MLLFDQVKTTNHQKVILWTRHDVYKDTFNPPMRIEQYMLAMLLGWMCIANWHDLRHPRGSGDLRTSAPENPSQKVDFRCKRNLQKHLKVGACWNISQQASQPFGGSVSRLAGSSIGWPKSLPPRIMLFNHWRQWVGVENTGKVLALFFFAFLMCFWLCFCFFCSLLACSICLLGWRLAIICYGYNCWLFYPLSTPTTFHLYSKWVFEVRCGLVGSRVMSSTPDALTGQVASVVSRRAVMNSSMCHDFAPWICLGKSKKHHKVCQTSLGGNGVFVLPDRAEERNLKLMQWEWFFAGVDQCLPWYHPVAGYVPSVIESDMPQWIWVVQWFRLQPSTGSYRICRPIKDYKASHEPTTPWNCPHFPTAGDRWFMDPLWSGCKVPPRGARFSRPHHRVRSWSGLPLWGME